MVGKLKWLPWGTKPKRLRGLTLAKSKSIEGCNICDLSHFVRQPLAVSQWQRWLGNDGQLFRFRSVPSMAGNVAEIRNGDRIRVEPVSLSYDVILSLFLSSQVKMVKIVGWGAGITTCTWEYVRVHHLTFQNFHHHLLILGISHLLLYHQ